MEPFRSPFYSIVFVALAEGHFRAEELDVTLTTAPVSGGTVQALLDGNVQISLGGLMRSFELADHGGPPLVHFAEVNSRNGFFLLAREPRPGFRWSHLAGKTVVSFAEAPTPWQCMLTVLRRNGVDPATVTIERRLRVPDAVAAFRAGHGDFLEQGQPTVERLLDEGAAHLVASMGDATGPVPFSSFMTTSRFLRDESDVVRRFTRAIYRAQQWIGAHEPADIAKAMLPGFPDIELPLLTRIVDRYRRQGTWAGNPILRRPAFDYLQQILLDGGFIHKRHRYEDLVDVAIAAQVVGEMERKA